MKNCIIIFVAMLLPVVGWATHGHGSDDSDTATGNANCNASFQEDCLGEATISSESVAAPVGIIGGGAIETLALIILLGSTLKGRISRRRCEIHPHIGGSRR
jgi:hypothetical protein